MGNRNYKKGRVGRRRIIYGKPKRGFGIIAAVVLILCGLVSYKRIDLNAEYASKAQERDRLMAQKDSLEGEKDDINDYKAYVQTKKYIEQVAREKLGLVYEDEIVFQTEE